MNQKVKKLNPYADQNRFVTNRQKRIQRHLKKHPQDEQALTALGVSVPAPTRKAPKEKLGWLNKNKALGELIKSKFIGSVTKDEANKWAHYYKTSKKVLFRLTPVTLYSEDKAPLVEFRHVSKLSNFTGKITNRVALLKAQGQTQTV